MANISEPSPAEALKNGLPHWVVAIDGPAASGKSSVARLVAHRLGFVYVNTGAMYRAATWLALQKGVAPADSTAVGDLLETAVLEFGAENHESTIRIDGVDPSPFLSDAAVNANVSVVAAIPKVREVLVARQREYVRAYNLVMEGRDIGTVVFPETPLKFYIDASPEVRAQRRALQGFHDDLVARDKIDSSRTTSPLKIADGAEVIDSSHLGLEGVVEEVVQRLKRKGLPVA